MNGLKYTKKIREYCDYIDNHLDNVRISWDRLQVACKNMHFVYDDYMWACIDSMVKDHDISKMSHEEFIPYQQKFFPVDSPNPDLFDAAWEHHKEHNPHHWQNWTAITSSRPGELTCHCVCMVIDWMAMARKFGGSAEQYYRDNMKKFNHCLPHWARTLIEEIFNRLRKES